MSFKIIAVRPLKGCAKGILKNLVEDEFYFFDNEYSKSNSEDIEISPEKEKLPHNFFFEADNNSSLKSINIQALVGKNGEGKSSLIELCIRILNNFYKQYKFGKVTDRLMFAEGLFADLFYEYNSKIIKIHIDSRKVEFRKTEPFIIAKAFVDQNLIYDSTDEKYSNFGRYRIDEFLEVENLFFTMYINYSIYGLDETDYIDENKYADEKDFPFDVVKKINGILSDSWLSQIFHKNDGYQTPIVLHPYRIQGQIDIIKEKYLLSQRLLSLIIEEENNKYHITDDLIADQISLDFIEKDSLDEYLEEYIKRAKSIDDYFKVVDIPINENVTKDEIFQTINNYYDFLKINDSLLQKFKNNIHFHTQNSNPTDLFRINAKLFSNIEVNKNQQEPLENRSEKNIEDYISRIKKRFPEEELKKIEFILRKTEGFNFEIFNLFQLLSIYFNFWSKNLSIDEKRLELDLLDYKFESNLFYYIVMKSFKTIRYPKYSELNRADTIEYFSAKFVLNIDLTIKPHEEFLKKISDEDGSHISLKVRQSIRMLRLSLENPEDKLIKYYKSKIGNPGRIDFKILNNFIKEKLSNNEDRLLYLPPRIFKLDIYLKSISNNQNDISIKKISSGEYQKNAIITSLIYHLKNLDSVEANSEKASESVKVFKSKATYAFENINIILDEIELYFHPEFQRQFIRDLLFKLSKTKFKNIKNINLLFITHSPFILSDIPKINVLFLEKGKPVLPMSENTFAANIHTLLQHGFFLNSVPIGEFAKDKINYYFDLLHKGKILDELGIDLYNQIILVSEPFIKSQLLKLYFDLKSNNSEVQKLISNLQTQIDNLKKGGS